ncbi:MAG TPA: T9SS type A sorting domain-containing protein [bacterium]|nr:T9SS type A sorting domain-containing protein [bacterium]
MKRFAKTISLAACLVFLCGAAAMAADLVTVESKSVAPGATGVTLGVYISNDQAAVGFVMPLEFRTQTGGAYIVGSFTRGATAGGRLNNSPLGSANPQGPPANITQNRYAVPGGTACSGPTSNTYQTPAANIDFVSPDAILHATVSTGDENVGDDIDLDPGSDPSGNPSYSFTFNVLPNLGTFIVDTCCVRPANHLSYVDRNTNLVAMNFVAGIVTVEVPPNFCPNATIDNPVVNASVGSPASNDADATDADGSPNPGDPIQFYLLSGPGSVDPSTGAWSYTPTCNDIPSFQVSIYASDRGPSGCQSGGSVVSFTVNVSPAPLQIACNNVSVHWGALASMTPTVSGGCPPYSLALISGPGALNAGAWEWQTACSDVGTQPVTIRATDANQSTIECTFNASVTNQVPTCTAIDPTLAPQGVPTVIDLGDLSQADGDGLVYTYVGGLPGAWNPVIAGDQFSATRPAGDGASYTVDYTVSDGCVTVDCSFDLIFENPCVAIVKQGTDSGYACWLNGEHATVCVVAEPGALPGDAGGYDLLICYDQSGLSFLGATGGPQGWEYFTYRTGQFGGNCSGGCPDGYVRLVSIAEMNNGVEIDPSYFNLDGETLACLTFNVTSDRNFINSCLHVGFCSFDCGDNSFSDKSGNTLWVPRDGVVLGPYYDCDGNAKPGYVIEPEVSYCGGAICVCEPPDDRGDLNLNGIANEIGDAVLYTNYFIYGSGVWNPVWAQSQILASDINDDGIVLTVADLIYLIRIITGDEAPFPPGTNTGSPKLSPYANSVDVTTDVANGAVTVRTNSSVDIGAALLVFRYNGSVGAPVLANNSGLTVRSNAANGELRVLVSQTVEAAATRLTAGANSLVTIPVDGSIELVETQFSDYNGALLSVNAASAVVPTSYALEQNYPNPFNAGTVIPFTLTKESEFSLTIYNVAGQVVRTFSGMGHVGTNNVEWNGLTADGTSAATGMYFYRVTTPEFTATKKMVLIK